MMLQYGQKHILFSTTRHFGHNSVPESAVKAVNRVTVAVYGVQNRVNT